MRSKEFLKTSALQAAQESLYYVGIDSFNFDQEITSRVFSSPLPLESTRRLIEPFLYLEKQESWYPLTVFSQQRLEALDKLEKDVREFYDNYLYDEYVDLQKTHKDLKEKNFTLSKEINTKKDVIKQIDLETDKYQKMGAVDKEEKYVLENRIRRAQELRINMTSAFLSQRSC